MLLIENNQIVAGFVPVDMSAGANNGDWVSMKNFSHIAIVFIKAAGTAGDDPTLTINQAKDVSGTDSKALNFTNLHVKQGTLSGIGEFTKITQAEGNTYTEATSAEKQAVWVVEFDVMDLDINNGFDCVQAAVADIGNNAQLGCVLYILSQPRSAGSPLISAITD